MKSALPILLLLLGSITLFSNDRNQNRNTGETYAVVIGIADYQDGNIPDLQFADDDALAFAGFLQSEAGGSLDENHLKVLINEEAKMAEVAIAFDWLLDVAKEDDKVIIYFSGHGDVERKTISQPGFLLCWDAPAKVYMAGGAYGLGYLQEIVSTLAVTNEAKVIVITDACRSGKLSGSAISGPSLTLSNLAKQFANEIKILSCEPKEYSVEGEQWGGGRGAFSYYLLKGLYGMADGEEYGNEDYSVSLRELRKYLEENVSDQVAPEKQNPMAIGGSAEILANVNASLLDRVRLGTLEQMPQFTRVESRGIEDVVLDSAADSVKELYANFKQALENKIFLSPQDSCADAYYKKLMQEPGLEELYNSMTRNYAAALQNDAQQVLNVWLKTNVNQKDMVAKKKNLTVKEFRARVRTYPAYLKRAAELLGDKHYMYKPLQARRYFFEGYIQANSTRNPDTSVAELALAAFDSAVINQPDLSAHYWQMSIVHGYLLEQPDSMEHYALEAIKHYPHWVKPHTDLAYIYVEKYRNKKKAKEYLKKAKKLDDGNVDVWNGFGLYHTLERNRLQAIDAYKKAIEIDSTNSSIYSNLGNVYFNKRRPTKKSNNNAAEAYIKAIELDSTNAIFHSNLGLIYIRTDESDKAEQSFLKAIELDSTYYFAHHDLGILYYINDRFEEAEAAYNKAIQLNPNRQNAYRSMTYLKVDLEKWDEAFSNLEEVLKKGNPSFRSMKRDRKLKSLRKQKERWDALMEKYYPDQQ